MLDFALMRDVRLRLFEERDADELYRLIDDNRERLARWMPWASPQTLDGTRQFIRRTRQQLADNNVQTALTVGGRIAGVVGVHGISWELGNTSVRYWLARSSRDAAR